jgi:hypothetical protein
LAAPEARRPCPPARVKDAARAFGCSRNTVREAVSAPTFVGYADALSKSYTTLLAERVSAHLAWHGVDLHRVVWQTDNGSEFLENQLRRGLPSAVRALGSDHRYIPPKALPASDGQARQSDVGTVHRLVEDEFFDHESFRSPAEFWAKAITYWHYFNLARLNRGKEWQSPHQIIRRHAPHLNPAIACWQALDLGHLHSQYFPRYPKGRSRCPCPFPRHRRFPLNPKTARIIVKRTSGQGCGDERHSL